MTAIKTVTTKKLEMGRRFSQNWRPSFFFKKREPSSDICLIVTVVLTVVTIKLEWGL